MSKSEDKKRFKSDNNCFWNELWNGLEEKISSEDKKCFDIDVNKQFFSGVITEVVDNTIEVVYDDIHFRRLRFERCYIKGLSVGDWVVVESNGEEFTVKPLRYKILTSRISEEWTQLFIFGSKAFIRKSDVSPHLRVGDVLKCVVIESSGFNEYKWRAFPYTSRTTQPEDIQSIEIPQEISFGDLKIKSTKSLSFPLKNKSEEIQQTLQSIDIIDGNERIRLKISHRLNGKRVVPPYVIPPNSEAFVKILCKTKFCGQFNRCLVFTFNGFQIERFISINVFLSDNKQKNSKNRVHRRRYFGDYVWVVPGRKSSRRNRHQINKLKEYVIPDTLWITLKESKPIIEVFPELTEKLNKTNYSKRFHALLYLEECESHLSLQKFDLKEVSFKRVNQYFITTVKGLTDDRPSLIIGDRVLVSKQNNETKDENNIRFEGYIREIREEDIIIEFSEQFENDFNGGQFRLEFQINRAVFRFCHNAIDLMSESIDVLFPQFVLKTPLITSKSIESIEWFNKSLNVRQKKAVIGVLCGQCRPSPFIILGPPGTGKTSTIIESILQVFHQLKESRIIVCTSDNVSADLIVERLLDSNKISVTELIRIIAFHRVDSVPQRVQSVTKIATEDPKEWLFHRVIVSTTSHSGIILRYKISETHFSHVFIEESGQVTEPESLIPISLCVNSKRENPPVVVLCGDHKQLSPFVHSNNQKVSHLKISLMERLMSGSDPYTRNHSFRIGYHSRFAVKLIDNYRSVAQIMEIPSKLFYGNELKFHKSMEHKLLLSLKIGFSVHFEGVDGNECQEEGSYSWYNPHEITSIISYLKRMLKAGIDHDHIGIITPYRSQVKAIQTQIKSQEITECKVGTIEEYRGLEKRIIILSTVRSKDLGFNYNPKRFNVAVSRAKALLIVIGNPKALSRAKCWSQLINFCILHNSYTGCQYQEYSSWD